MSHPLWKPICDHELSVEVWRTVRQIALDLDPADDLPTPLVEEMTGPSLAVGQGGPALLLAYLAAEPTVDAGSDHLAVERLEKVLEGAETASLPPNLYGGVAGVAWTLEHLGPRLFAADEEDSNGDIDLLLIEHLSKVPWVEDYDVVSGLVGYGVYALERLPRPTAATLLEKVIDHLEAWAESTPQGITWLSRPHLLWEETAALFPEGCYNLGLAHGVPGIVALLGQNVAAGVAVDRARPLLEGAVSWLLAQRLPEDSPSAYTDLIGPDGMAARGEAPRPSRLAWCYGDAGVAVALLGAAIGAERADWRRAALDIARGAARRSKEQARVKDAGLCHGAAGLAHLFNRMYQATGEPWLKDTALRWIRETLELRDPSVAAGGFASWEPDSPGGDFSAVPRTGLLTGSSGIALALLAAVSHQEPTWDRVLLSAVPPRAVYDGSCTVEPAAEASLLGANP